jgi:hypothetical protein
MRRRHRILLSIMVAVASVSTVISLVLLGTETEGPLGRALEGIGSGVSQAESRVMRSVRGSGRSKALQWADPLRRDPDALRRPDTLLLGAYHDSLPASLQGVLQLEAALGTTLPLIQIYTAWGDRPDQRFPGRLSRAIADLRGWHFSGLIAWMMWLFLHVVLLIGFRNRFAVLFEWFWAYLTRERSARLITGDAEELRNAVHFIAGESAASVLDRAAVKRVSASTKL